MESPPSPRQDINGEHGATVRTVSLHRTTGPRLDTPSQLLLLVVGTIVVLSLFSAKPLHIDDPLFVWTAKQIQNHPTDFFGFDVNWNGLSEPMHIVNQNPPGAAYYLTLVSPLTGFDEVGMHLAFLLPNLALVLGTFVLARRFCDRPLLATIAGCGTPVAIISATTLMSDTMMAAFWCWAMVLWLAGLDRRSPLCFLGAGALIAAAALTKYFGFCVLPLLIAYSIVRERRPGWWLMGTVIPLAAITAYDVWARHLYGHSLLQGAASYAITSREGKGTATSLLIGLFYLGGGTLTIACAAPWLWRPRVLILAIVLVIACLAGLIATAPPPFDQAIDESSVRWVFPLHAVVFLLAAANVIALAVFDPVQRRSADSLLLALWFIGTFIFAAAINWTVTARTLVPLAPVAGILLARRLDWIQQFGLRATNRSNLATAIGAGVAVSLILAWADNRFAHSQRDAAVGLVSHYSQSSQAIWFEGHWGLQYYFQQSGAKLLDDGQVVVKGDIVILPDENVYVNAMTQSVAEPVGIAPFERASWVATVAKSLNTNFYASDDISFLPFVFGPVPPDQFRIDRIKKTVRLKFQGEDKPIAD